MSDAEKTPDPIPSPKEPGPQAQRTARTTARIIREMDMMRAGYDAVLRGVDTSQLVLEGPPGLNPQDQIKIKLHHVVQRFDKEVRGLVRTIEPIDAQLQRITVELFTRLTPIELSVLKMCVDASSGTTEKRWY
jgi:hypothetical protein